MNEAELRAFKATRSPSHALRRGVEVAKLACYGCAHSAASVPYPSRPSGERPCCSCVRNPEDWADGANLDQRAFVVDDQGTARDFNPFTGSAYNGAPLVHFPMDNYVTLDARDQDDFYQEHPEYLQAIRFDADGNCMVVL